MEVRERGSSPGAGVQGIVSRPHVPAMVFFGLFALVLGLIVAGVFRTIVWDGSAMMVVPLLVLVSFASLLFLVLYHLTAVAVVEGQVLTLRRFGRVWWRIEASEAYMVYPTPGILEGGLHIVRDDGSVRTVPGSLLRGLRTTWIDGLRARGHPAGFDGKAHVRAAAALRRAARQGAGKATPHPNDDLASAAWSRPARVSANVSVGLCVVAYLLPDPLVAFPLILVNAVAGLAIAAKARLRGGRMAVVSILLVMTCLVPFLLTLDVALAWRTLAPGFGRAATWPAVVIWAVLARPVWRGLDGRERVGVLLASALAAWMSFTAVQAVASYANMRFDNAMARREPALIVSAAHEKHRYTPAYERVTLNSTHLPTGFGVHVVPGRYAAGDIAAGATCTVDIHPGWLGVPWVDLIGCKAR